MPFFHFTNDGLPTMSALTTILLIHLVAVATPGPDFFYISQTAAKHGRQRALVAVMGTGIGIAFWITLAVLGLTVLVKGAPMLHSAITIAGGIYLIWMGVQAIRGSFKATPSTAPSSKVQDEARPLKKQARFFGKALLIELSNPKSVVYFGSIFSLFLNPGNTWVDNATLWCLLTAESTLWFVLVALLFSTPSIRHLYARGAHIIDRMAGGLFVLLGGRIVYGAFRP